MSSKPEYLRERLPWFKVIAKEWLRGPMHDAGSLSQATLINLLCLAADSPFEDDEGNTRDIKIDNNTGYTDEQFCSMLKLTAEEWLYAKKKLSISPLNEIKVNPKTNIITLLKWGKFQTPYQYQKPYQKRYHDNVKQTGYKSYDEALSASVADLEKFSNPEKIFIVLKYFPERWHEKLKKRLDQIYPEGHGFDKAKEMWNEWRKEQKEKDGQ